MGSSRIVTILVRIGSILFGIVAVLLGSGLRSVVILAATQALIVRRQECSLVSPFRLSPDCQPQSA